MVYPDKPEMSCIFLSSDDTLPQEFFLRVSRVRRSHAVAIAIDLSESVGEIDELVNGFSRSLRSINGRSSLWVFALSSPAPLNNTKEDLVDDLKCGAISLVQMCSDRNLRDTLIHSGTFIRPVIKGIQKLSADHNVDCVDLFVLTDGELLDLEAVSLPKKIRCLGISENHPSDAWKRVLRGSEIVKWTDNRIESCDIFKPRDSCDFCIHFEIINDSSSGSFKVSGYENREILTDTKLVCKAKDERIDVRIEILEVKAENFIVKVVDPLGGILASSSLDQIQRMSKSDLPRTECSFTQDGGVFQIVGEFKISEYEDGVEFVDRLNSHLLSRKALSTNPALKNFIIEKCDSVISCDAFLVFVRDRDKESFDMSDSIFVFGLNESSTPALRLTRDVHYRWGACVNDFCLSFDQYEGRWVLESGLQMKHLLASESREINVDFVSPGPRYRVLFLGS